MAAVVAEAGQHCGDRPGQLPGGGGIGDDRGEVRRREVADAAVTPFLGVVGGHLDRGSHGCPGVLPVVQPFGAGEARGPTWIQRVR